MAPIDDAHLDAAQRAAVDDPNPFVRIIAPAGSGKTAVLAKRIERRIRSTSRRPGRIIGVSFTRTAASELGRRLSHVEAGTFESTTLHALALRIVSMAGERFREFVPQLVSDPGSVFVRAGMPAPSRGALSQISAHKASRVPLPRSLELVAADYQQALRRFRLMDFEDLVTKAADRVAANVRLRRELQQDCAGIFIDEFQDTTREQWRLLHALLSDSGHTRNTQYPIECTIVGDPNQSIYGFAGATPALFETFAVEMPGVTTHTLTRNYRSSESVLSASASLRGSRVEIAESLGGSLPDVVVVQDEEEEARQAADLVLSTRAGSGATIAVIARTRKLLTGADAELRSRGIDTQVGSANSAMSDPSMRALFTRLREHERNHAETHWHGPLLDAALEGDASAKMVLDLLEETLPEYRMWNVHRLANEVATWDRHRQHSQPVILTTFHGTKGAAYDRVIILGMDSGGLPFSGPEEQRLLYVATTRARKQLTFLTATTRAGAAVTPHPLLASLTTEEAPLSAMPILATENGPLMRDKWQVRAQQLREVRSTLARATLLPEVGILSDAEIGHLAQAPDLALHVFDQVMGAQRAAIWAQRIMDLSTTD